MNDKSRDVTPWWGELNMDENTACRWDVGPSSLWIYRAPNEWRIVHDPRHAAMDPANDSQDVPGETRSAPDAMTDRSRPRVPVDADDVLNMIHSAEHPDSIRIKRHSFKKTDSQISVMPALADRTIVSRPEQPLSVPAGESVTLYLSMPVWIRIETTSATDPLQEIPSFRMSDTWFGQTTRQGELCYATRTSGRMRLENVPVRLHRAITPLSIHNKAEDALTLDRVQIPAPHLSLYAAENDVLWTEAVTMTRRHGHHGAEIHIRSGAPDDADGAKLLQKARETSKKGLMTSTFSAVGSLFAS